MITIEEGTIDYNAIPQALLPRFKRHAVIDHCDDDELILDYLQDAIGEFQRVSQISIYAASIIARPELVDFQDSQLLLPVTPVNTLAIADGAVPPNDLTAAYPLTWTGRFGVRFYRIAGTAVDGLALSIATGYTPATLPPDIRQVLIRMTAELYEHREIYAAGTEQVPEAWRTDTLAGFWFPRC